MWDLILIGGTALIASLLTFFSGFGLGTLLMPIMALFFPVDVAIALTGVVHFLNNLFKLSLIGSHIDKKATITFGIPAIAGAFVGGWLLVQLGEMAPFSSYELAGNTYNLTTINIIIAILMVIFALFELLPKLREWVIPREMLGFGGLLSGFFGGLSGHQGALRSAFLVHFGLTKEAFIATGTTIATFIDITRLIWYATSILSLSLAGNWPLLATAVGCAFVGAYVGRQLLKKITIITVQYIVGVLLLVLAILLGMGII